MSLTLLASPGNAVHSCSTCLGQSWNTLAGIGLCGCLHAAGPCAILLSASGGQLTGSLPCLLLSMAVGCFFSRLKTVLSGLLVPVCWIVDSCNLCRCTCTADPGCSPACLTLAFSATKPQISTPDNLPLWLKSGSLKKTCRRSYICTYNLDK